MVKNSTMGKLRMVKAMTGRAIPRIRFLKVIYVQTFCMPRGKLCEGTSTWGCCPGLQDQWQGRAPSATGAAARSSTPPATYSWRFRSKCNAIKVDRTWGHLDEAREAPVGQRWLLAVHFRFEEVVELAPVSAKVQRQLKGVCQFTWFLNFSCCISLSQWFHISCAK